jgi:hypothetical protein
VNKPILSVKHQAIAQRMVTREVGERSVAGRVWQADHITEVFATYSIFFVVDID